MRLRTIGDPPGPGECKLRIKSNGTPQGTFVLIVDDVGVERSLLGAIAVSWEIELPREHPVANVRVIESEAEVEAGPLILVKPEK
jgi:hypothetical protein